METNEKKCNADFCWSPIFGRGEGDTFLCEKHYAKREKKMIEQIRAQYEHDKETEDAMDVLVSEICETGNSTLLKAIAEGGDEVKKAIKLLATYTQA